LIIYLLSFRWISEKLDGIRVYWNGYTMASKYGKKIPCPDWFIEELPKDITLDGELWMGRGNWELIMKVLNTNDNLLWKNISFMVFDLPNSNEPYEVRVRDMARLHLPKHVHVVDIEKCKGNNHPLDLLGKILENGGEGLMLNKPGSLYVKMRTDTLLKVKV
jgi:DNA ligase-1